MGPLKNECAGPRTQKLKILRQVTAVYQSKHGALENIGPHGTAQVTTHEAGPDLSENTPRANFASKCKAQKKEHSVTKARIVPYNPKCIQARRALSLNRSNRKLFMIRAKRTNLQLKCPCSCPRHLFLQCLINPF